MKEVVILALILCTFFCHVIYDESLALIQCVILPHTVMKRVVVHKTLTMLTYLVVQFYQGFCSKSDTLAM